MENKKSKALNLRYNILTILTYMVALVLCFRLFYLQVIKGEEYRQASSSRLTRETVMYADRGEILDCNGVKLVTTSTGYSLNLYKTSTDSTEINKNILNIINVLEENGDSYNDNLIFTVNPFSFTSDNEEYIKKWKKSNGISEDYTAEQVFEFFKNKYEINEDNVEIARKIMAIRFEINQKGYSTIKPVQIASNISKNSILKFSEQNAIFSGIDIVTNPVVTYNNGNLASHVLGYCGKINETELETLAGEYSSSELIGKTGVQYVFEKYLRGQNGTRQIDMDVNGNITGEYITSEPVKGCDVKLTIDAKIQQVAEQALKEDIEKISGGGYAETSEAKSGAVVVMNIKTGEILALASYPDFDPQLFVNGISTEQYNEYRESEALYNRAISGTYAPGSTFKMITAVARFGARSSICKR